MNKISDKNLKDKAIDIKGKKYVMVADRLKYFNDTYEAGSIQTKLLSQPHEDRIVVAALVCPDTLQPNRVFSGHAQEKIGDGFINKTSALENAETSAVGRALAMMGIGVVDSVASVDEINKAKGLGKEDLGKLDTTMQCECGGGVMVKEGISSKNNKPYRKQTCDTCGKLTWGDTSLNEQ